MKEIGSQFVDKLIRQYGSPFFVIFEETLRENLKTFRKEFLNQYPKVEVAYAYKANHLLGVLNILHKCGAWAEVASGYEYEVAKRLGLPGEYIVFNGPYKREDELMKAYEEGALINVDNIQEINLLGKIASQLGKSIDIGIRINADVGIHQLPDRFGFNLETGEAIEVVKKCVEEKHLRIVGIHIHLTSYIVDPDKIDNGTPAKNVKLIWPKSPDLYRVAARKVVRFAKEIIDKFGVSIKYIDMGGGFPTIADLAPYVEATVEPVLNGLKQALPILILEPGRAIVKNAVHLITTVVAMKEFSNGIKGIVIDAGMNLLPTSIWRFQEIETLTKTERNLYETVVYGPLCLQTDIISKVKLPKLKVGDKLIVKNVGAYNISQSSSFIFPRPLIVLLEDKETKILRRSETVNDIYLFEELV